MLELTRKSERKSKSKSKFWCGMGGDPPDGPHGACLGGVFLVKCKAIKKQSKGMPVEHATGSLELELATGFLPRGHDKKNQ